MPEAGQLGQTWVESGLFHFPAVRPWEMVPNVLDLRLTSRELTVTAPTSWVLVTTNWDHTWDGFSCSAGHVLRAQ